MHDNNRPIIAAMLYFATGIVCLFVGAIIGYRVGFDDAEDLRHRHEEKAKEFPWSWDF